MSQPTYDRLVTQLDRLGLWRVKDTLPEALKSAEDSELGYAAFLDQLLEEEIAAREERRIKVLDEVGYLPLSRAEANYLFQVVAYRYERSSVILTSNKSVTEWPEVFGDHAIATAILDRRLHHSHVLSIKGHSYRLRERTLATTQAPALAPA